MEWKILEESTQGPSDLEFKIHVEELIHLFRLEESKDMKSNVNILILDDANESKEVEEA